MSDHIAWFIATRKKMWQVGDIDTTVWTFGFYFVLDFFISKTLTLTCTCITFWKSYCLKCQNAPMEPFLDWQLTAFQMYSMGESDHCIYHTCTYTIVSPLDGSLFYTDKVYQSDSLYEEVMWSVKHYFIISSRDSLFWEMTIL